MHKKIQTIEGLKLTASESIAFVDSSSQLLLHNFTPASSHKALITLDFPTPLGPIMALVLFAKISTSEPIPNFMAALQKRGL